MSNLKAKMKKEGGFTLIEMLIVVAIIAILIAISIPMVNSALESAREATDAANKRAARGLAMVEVLGKNSLAGVDIATTTETKLTAWYVIKDSEGSLVTGTDAPAASAGGAYGKGTKLAPDTTSHVGETIKIEYTIADGTFAVDWAK